MYCNDMQKLWNNIFRHVSACVHPYGTNKVSHPLVSKDTKYKAAFTNFLLPKCVLDLVWLALVC